MTYETLTIDQVSNSDSAKITFRDYHHMPDYADYDVIEGQTLRQALAALRHCGRENFGDMGGLTAYFSDDSELSVELQAASDGGYLLNSQRIIRTLEPRTRRERRHVLQW